MAPTLPLRTVFTRFWPYARPFRGKLAVALGLGLILPVTQTATIWAFKLLVDDVLVPQDITAFAPIAGLYLGITLLAGALTFAGTYLSRWLAQHFVLRLRTAVFGHLHRLSLDVLERFRTGDLLSRLTSDVNAVERLVVSGVTSSLSNTLRVVLFTGALFVLQWQLALAALAIVPIFALVARSFSRRIKHASRQARHVSGQMTATAEESLGNAPLVHAYQRQGTEIDRFHAQGRERLDAQLRAARLSAGFGPLVDSVELVGVLVVVGVGTVQLASGQLTLGGLLAFVAYLSQLYRPIRSLTRLTNTVYAASAGAERIDEVLRTRSTVPTADRDAAPLAVRGDLQLDGVGFSYPGAAHPVLDRVHARVRPGEVLAVVGPSGVGKSTLTKLILRFYDPDAGAVRLDGRDVRDLDVGRLRDAIAVVLQETLIFHGTIGENIAYGRAGATDADVRAAARMAGLDDVIAGLPDGYDTVVGERGRSLSGGQRQRVAIARALVRDAPVLILDEPLTGLDAATRERVLAPLRRLSAGRTTVLITHEPDLLALADRVVELAPVAEPAPDAAPAPAPAPAPSSNPPETRSGTPTDPADLTGALR